MHASAEESNLIRVDDNRWQKIFSDHQHRIYRDTDKLFAFLLLVEWIAGMVTASLWSPKTWAGAYIDVHMHVWMALWLGLAIISLPILCVVRYPGGRLTRHIIAIGQALMTALLIHLSGGRIETHFLIFGSLAFLAFYRDWPVLITSSVVVALDHFLRGMYFPQSVFGMAIADNWRWFEHVAWVCFSDIFFIRWCIQSKQEMRNIAEQRAVLEDAYEIIEREVILRTGEARANEERFRTLCSAAPVTIFETNLEGRWIFVGDQWQMLTARNPKEALKDGWLTAVHPDDVSRVYENWHYCVSHSTDWADEFRLLLPDLSIRWVRGIAAVCQTERSSELRHIGTIEDITQFKQNEENQRQIAVMEQRQEFMATLSHDLKNPIIGANRILELFVGGVLGPLTKKQTDLLDQLRDSNESLLKMIQNLIAAYRYDEQSDSMQLEKLDLWEISSRCIREVQTLADEKHISITAERPKHSVLVLADESAMLRVMRNLLDNALKFTPPFGKITLSHERRNGDNLLRLHNTGSFIPEEKRAMLFRRFWQGQDGKRYVPGTGLGLYICKQILDTHRGHITCVSDQGGTEFLVTIPSSLLLAPAIAPETAAKQVPVAATIDKK